MVPLGTADISIWRREELSKTLFFRRLWKITGYIDPSILQSRNQWLSASLIGFQTLRDPRSRGTAVPLEFQQLQVQSCKPKVSPYDLLTNSKGTAVPLDLGSRSGCKPLSVTLIDLEFGWTEYGCLYLIRTAWACWSWRFSSILRFRPSLMYRLSISCLHWFPFEQEVGIRQWPWLSP